MVTGPGFLASPAATSPGPSLVPLFRPLEAKSGMGLLPPRYQYDPSGNFSKKSFPGKYPRVIGPAPKNYQTNLTGG
jgi:hypothetical protein